MKTRGSEIYDCSQLHSNFRINQDCKNLSQGKEKRKTTKNLTVKRKSEKRTKCLWDFFLSSFYLKNVPWRIFYDNFLKLYLVLFFFSFSIKPPSLRYSFVLLIRRFHFWYAVFWRLVNLVGRLTAPPLSVLCPELRPCCRDDTALPALRRIYILLLEFPVPSPFPLPSSLPGCD